MRRCLVGNTSLPALDGTSACPRCNAGVADGGGDRARFRAARRGRHSAMDVARGPGSVDGSAASRSDPADGVRWSGGSLAGACARRGAAATRARLSALSAAASSSGRSVRAPPPQVAPPRAAAGRAGGPAVLAAVLAAASRGGRGVGGARRFGSTGVISGGRRRAALRLDRRDLGRGHLGRRGLLGRHLGRRHRGRPAQGLGRILQTQFLPFLRAAIDAGPAALRRRRGHLGRPDRGLGRRERAVALLLGRGHGSLGRRERAVALLLESGGCGKISESSQRRPGWARHQADVASMAWRSTRGFTRRP